MEKYIPDVYQKSIYTIEYSKLLDRGIKCLLFDLDNTLVPASIKISNNKIKELFKELKEKGFDVHIFSNSSKSRVKIFADELQVDYCASACKPFKYKFKKLLYDNDYNESQVAIIGDQILTDVLGGNLVGITTILVNPISQKDFFLTRFTRIVEKKIIKKLRKYDLLILGKYYD
ncbi:MAG: YqeG family HAD IIIA-type phosphatase [Bacilli bacterium]|nr:YqeG family HAD IIIA-type phosphatase [Bacilli bacterium]MDD4282458.1 YqeG family HAD IIIA-type phosphatase [Bacilli bacterium]MDD4718945.1 YqeG family HAD IIIA-type phosphatase [Bacilli bacterium]